jgi:hypothetical protein
MDTILLKHCADQATAYPFRTERQAFALPSRQFKDARLPDRTVAAHDKARLIPRSTRAGGIGGPSLNF